MKKEIKITLVGVGLIGGSFSKAIRKILPHAEISGVDTNASHIKDALSLGLIDRQESIFDAVFNANIIIISVPVNTLPELLPYILDHCSNDALVTDAGSTKIVICESVVSHPKRRNFVAAHPIAGTENSGPSAALENLFNGKKNIICESHLTDPVILDNAIELFSSLGMINIFMSAEEHDLHFARLSHLSHVIAFALANSAMEMEPDENINALAGSGFASTVRLAKSHPEMWTSIFLQNKQFLLEAISTFSDHLEELKLLISGSNDAGISQYICKANRMKEIIGKKENLIVSN